MDRRRAFLVAASIALLLTFGLLVVGPAVERGGVQEVLILVAAVAGILLFERFLRTR